MLNLNDEPVDVYKRPEKQVRIVQLCPICNPSYAQAGLSCLALGSDGKVYGVDAEGKLCILEDRP